MNENMLNEKYDANIPRAASKTTVMREISFPRKIFLRIQGCKDRRKIEAKGDSKRCASHYSQERLRKLAGDIEVLDKYLQVDTLEGTKRIAQIDRRLEQIDVQQKASREKLDKATQELRKAGARQGDEGVSQDVMDKRVEHRVRKGTAAIRSEIASLNTEKRKLWEEKCKIEEVHRARECIAESSKKALCDVFQMEMHIYLRAAKAQDILPPSVEEQRNRRLIAGFPAIETNRVLSSGAEEQLLDNPAANENAA